MQKFLNIFSLCLSPPAYLCVVVCFFADKIFTESRKSYQFIIVRIKLAFLFSLSLSNLHSFYTVWPVKSHQMSIKVAQNDSTWKMKDFALKCGRFGQNKWCYRLWKVAQSAINPHLVTLFLCHFVRLSTSHCSYLSLSLSGAVYLIFLLFITLLEMKIFIRPRWLLPHCHYCIIICSLPIKKLTWLTQQVIETSLRSFWSLYSAWL